MLIELTLIGIFIIVLIIIFLVALFAWGMKYAIAFALNRIIGFFALYAMKSLGFFPDLAINIWSVILVAIFGLIGFIFVLIMHAMGVLF